MRHAYYLTYETPDNPAIEPAINQLLDGLDGVDYQNHQIQIRLGFSRIWKRRWTRAEASVEHGGGFAALQSQLLGITQSLRNPSETYSYLTFKDRVVTDTRFLEEVLSYASANAAKIKKAIDDADKRNLVGQQISLRSKLKRDDQKVEILMGDTEDAVNPLYGPEYAAHVSMCANRNRCGMKRPLRVRIMNAFPRITCGHFDVAIERLKAHGITDGETGSGYAVVAIGRISDRDE